MTLAFLTGSPADWMIILIVALLVFGPQKMPEVGRQLGQALRDFRKMADELTGVAHSVRDEVDSAYRTAQPPVKPRVYDQEPEDRMAPVVAPVPKADPAPGEAETKGH